MDLPEKTKSATTEPENRPARNIAQTTPQDSATEFFPNSATVRTALESAQIGIWSWDSAANTITWSSNLESLHGAAPGSFDGTYAGFMENIHRDDQADVEASLQQALRTQSAYRARYRVPQRNGHDECWLKAAADDGLPSSAACRGSAPHNIGLASC